MGDVAEGILNGDFDEETGEYIGDGQGFPRSLNREHREDGALYGVKNYLRNKVPNWNNTMVAYNKDVLKLEFVSTQVIAENIQKDFGKFVKYVNEQRIILKAKQSNDNDQSCADDHIDYLNSKH